jgi:curved DNA-binding protein CbpA
MTSASFEDYYEDLQISPNADQETIERVYRLLAKRYHPDNAATGDAGKFDIITKAQKVLSDPEARAAYDAGYEESKARQVKALSRGGLSNGTSTNGAGSDRHIRHGILSILYIEKRKDASNAGVGLWRLEQLLGWPEKTLEFHTWYLKEKGWIQRTDTGGYAITVDGVDVVEENELILGKDRLLSEKTYSAGRRENPASGQSGQEDMVKVLKKR